MRDKYPSSSDIAEIGVTSLDNNTEPETHWTGYAIDPRGIIYFDSYGLPRSREFIEYVNPHKTPVWYSTLLTQTITDLNQYAAEK